MAPFSRVVKCQNSSKTHLFQELENILISRWHLVTKMSPQMLILPISSPNKCQFLRKYNYFLTIFHFFRIKYTEEIKCINHITLLWISPPALIRLYLLPHYVPPLDQRRSEATVTSRLIRRCCQQTCHLGTTSRDTLLSVRNLLTVLEPMKLRR